MYFKNYLLKMGVTKSAKGELCWILPTAKIYFFDEIQIIAHVLMGSLVFF